MITNRRVFFGIFSLAAILSAKAATVSTGDLGQNVITAGGAYEWSPTVTSPTNGLPATLAVTYGLWNDPGTTVHAYVNGTEVGSFFVNNPYFDGTLTSTFEFTNLLVDGANTVRLDGLGASEGDYVISSIELNYNLPLPPVVVTNPPATNDPVSGPFVRNGTSVLHYTGRATLSGTDVAGGVRLQFHEQGNSSLQKLDLSATGLQPDTEYILIALLGADINASPIGTVKSDSKGRVRVSAMKNGSGHGGGNKALPAALDPVTEIHGLGLADSVNLGTVAFASLSGSPFQYLVKRNLTQQDTNATPAGSMSLKANLSSVNFHLLAGGLSANSTYSLALNSTVVATATANADGALQFNEWPATAPAVLDVHTLSLLDGSNNVVLSTTLPQ